MQQSQSSFSSSYMYPSSPTSSLPIYDSGYSSYGYSTPSPYPYHLSTCPYSSNDSFYMPTHSYESYYSPPSQATPQHVVPFVSSTPVPSSNVCLIPNGKESQIKRRQHHKQPMTSTPSVYQNRKRISDEAIDRLNAFYAIKKRPTEAEKDLLAVECNITLAQVNTWFNNARSRRGDTNPKLAQKILKQQIDSLNNQVALLQQQQSSSTGHLSF